MNWTNHMWTRWLRPHSSWLTLGLILLLALPVASLGPPGSHWRTHALLHVLISGLVGLCIWKREALRIGIPFVVLSALILRAIYFPIPVGNDQARYLWEGRIQLEGFNPYTVPPQHHDLKPFRDDPVWKDINHKDKTAIYPPGFQLLMRSLAVLNTGPLGLKILFLLADGINVLLLLYLLRLKGRHPAWALVYAANPAVLMAFAAEAHMDVLMITGLLGVLTAFTLHRWRTMFLCLAAAIQIKYVAVLLLPFLLRRYNLRHAGWLILPALLPFLVYSPLSSIFTTLTTFAQDMHFNGSIHARMGDWMEDYPRATSYSLRLFLAAAVLIRIKTPDPFTGGALTFLAFLLVSPNVHFWYLAWLAPFLAFYPLRSGLIWMAAIALAYHAPGMAVEQGAWREIPLWTRIAYLPVYGALLLDLLRGPAGRPLVSRPAVEAENTTLVIPTLNEAPRIREFLAQVQLLRPAPKQVLFSDGGSTDETCSLLQDAGCTVIHSPRGRGTQIHSALQAANGQILFVLHADMHLPPDLLARAAQSINRTGALGGAAGCRYRSTRPFLRVIAAANWIRAKWFGIGFGDQGLFFRRDGLEEMGGFPDMPIMEDVECSLRIREHGPFAYLDHSVSVSDRTWRKQSSLRHTLLVITLLLRYFFRRAAGRDTPAVQDLYNAYYPNHSKNVEQGDWRPDAEHVHHRMP